MLKKSHRILFFIAILAIALFAQAAVASADLWYQSTPLTVNGFSSGSPQISGNNVVWSGWGGNSQEIYFYNGSSVTTLTDNGFAEYSPQISGNNVVWYGYGGPGGTSEIYFYNGSSVTTLTDNGVDDRTPQISGNNVVWSGEGPNSNEIFFYDGSNVTTLTDNGFEDRSPQISGNNVVWEGWTPNGDEIFFYDGSSVTTLTDNGFDNRSPQISGNNVVWRGNAPSSWEIFFYNGSNVTTLTDDGFGDDYPQISGNNVVWEGWTPNGDEIFFYDGSNVTTLTDNGFGDFMPKISGSNVVWEGGDWPDSEIFFYNGSNVTTLTDNDYNVSPQISDSNVVWSGQVPSSNEIFLAQIDQLAPNDPNVTGSSHTFGAWSNNNKVTIDFAGATDNLSGVDGFSHLWTNQALSLPGTTKNLEETAASVTSGVLSDGIWYWHLRTVDNAGFWTNTVQAGPFKIDTAKPSATIKINQGDAYANSSKVTLNLSANDGSGSGAHKMRFKNQGGSWSSWETYKTTKFWTMTTYKGNKRIYAQVQDGAGNASSAVSDLIFYDPERPVTRMVTPFVSTKISKTTTFKVKWSATDPSPSSGIKSYTVRYRPSTSRTWRTWKSNTTAKEALFKGKTGVTYYFRTVTTDNAGNKDWSKVYKTIVPFNEGIFTSKTGFFGYKKLGKSQNYLTSVRYSYKRGHTLRYKLYKTNGIGLVVTKGPKMGRAKIYVDGKYVRTIDAKSSKTKPRQLIFYRNLKKKGTHYLKVVNLGTPGRAKFEVDAVVVKR